VDGGIGVFGCPAQQLSIRQTAAHRDGSETFDSPRGVVAAHQCNGLMPLRL
jgi:hypothetical protein